MGYPGGRDIVGSHVAHTGETLKWSATVWFGWADSLFIIFHS